TTPPRRMTCTGRRKSDRSVRSQWRGARRMSRSKQVEVDPAPSGCRQTVALSVLALEVKPPIGQTMESWLADEVVTDDLGRLAVPFETAKRLIAEKAARDAARAEKNRPVPAPGPRRVRGVPPVEG